jgi:hypothetical protein
MHYTSWDALKDILGVIGTFLIAAPWFYDFYLRRRHKIVLEAPAVGPLKQLQDDVVQAIQAKIDKPKIRDFVLAGAGLLCIFASFAIAFIRGISEWLF